MATMKPTSPSPDIPGKDAKHWRKQIESALAARREHEPWWEANDRAYAPIATVSPDTYGGDINTNRDYTLVERKKSDLFNRRPDVSLIPTPLMDGPIMDPATGQPLAGQAPQPGQPAATIPATVAVTAHEEIVNELLGPDGVDATRMVHQTLFDVLALSGVGFTKMGYESVTRPVPDPRANGGLLNNVGPIPVPLYENCFWKHFGPKQAIVPRDFRSTDWDRSPFLAYQFTLPLTPGNREKYKLPPEFQGKSDNRQYFDRGGSVGPEAGDVFTGVEGWYRSCLYREDQVHPEHITHFVLVDGLDDFSLHEDSPDQTILPTGELSPDSLIGYPLHPLNMRTRTDSAWPPADCTMTRPLVNELNVSRTQNLQFRDAMTLRWQYNTDTLPADALGKIVRSPIGGMIGVPGEAYNGEGAIKELPQGTMPRENFSIADYIDSDISRSWALDAAQQGGQSSESQTATAEQIQQANANARLDFERGIVLQWYCKGVTKFSTLVQRYLPLQRAVQIVGPQRAQYWDAWRKTVPSALAFTALPDSALRTDQAVARKSLLDFYTFVANDPFCQKARPKVLEKLFRSEHIDPTGLITPPDPPKPEMPKVSLAFKGEDLVAPQAPIVLEILQQLGFTISPGAVTQSQGMLLKAQQLAESQAQEQAAQKAAAKGDAAHGGKLAAMESLSKHHADETGGMQGIGGQAAMGAPGGQLQ